MAPHISFIDVSLGFPGSVVLEGVNLEIHPGSFAAILGRSGSGKSTLLSAVCGGPILVSGRIDVPARVGFVPQMTEERSTGLSAVETVALGVPSSGLRTKRAAREVAESLLDRLGLGQLTNRRLDELSGGQRQRVLIARALMVSSDVVVCDEPTSGADPVLSSEIADMLSGLAAGGTTVIVATHDITAFDSHLDRVIALHDRRVVFDGHPSLVDDTLIATIYRDQVEGHP